LPEETSSPSLKIFRKREGGKVLKERAEKISNRGTWGQEKTCFKTQKQME